MIGVGMFILGLAFSLPIVVWSLVNLDSKILRRTIELEQEIENLKQEIYRRVNKHAKTREDLAKAEIELDRLKLKYEKLLEEK